MRATFVQGLLSALQIKAFFNVFAGYESVVAHNPSYEAWAMKVSSSLARSAVMRIMQLLALTRAMVPP